MSGMRKYAGLIELDDAAPDVYETPELTDDASTIPASSTLRSESPASSPEGPNSADSAIDRHRIDPDEARKNFLNKDTRENTSHGWIGSKRAAYRTSNKRVHNGSLEEGFIDSTDDEGEESLERKLARLRQEISEVKEAFQKRRKEAELKQRGPGIKVEDTSVEKKDVEKKDIDPIEDLDSLGRVLENIERPEDTAHNTSARHLTRMLEEEYQKTDMLAPSEPKQAAEDNDTNQTSSSDQSSTLFKVSDFDKRLRLLEAALGLDLIPLPTQDRSAARAILPVLDGLDRQMSTISVTVSSLDKIDHQIKQMTEDAEKLTEARKAAAAQLSLNQSSSERKRMSATKKGGHTEEEREDVDQTSKVNALYGALPTIESLSPLLPSVLGRLRSLRTIHADAAKASDALSNVENRQTAMADEIKEWREGLEKVESALKQGETSMKENINVVDKWVKELESRIPKTSNGNHV